jgi:hypothetical protein
MRREILFHRAIEPEAGSKVIIHFNFAELAMADRIADGPQAHVESAR